MPVSEERNSTVKVISGVLNARKAESCSLQVCKFLIKTPLEITSWKFSVSFKGSLRNLVRTSFLVGLQTVYCKPATPVEGVLPEISRRATFRNTPCLC